MISEEVIKIDAQKHHTRNKICVTRSKYRRGRRETCVKVFTISDESKYLLIHNVPDIKIDVKQELYKLCERFGDIEKLNLTDYPNCEEFTKVYLIKFKKFVNAVKAKKSLDDKNFLGSILHICYAPELESIDETQEKMNDRKRYVTQKLAQIDRNYESQMLERSEPQSCKTNTSEENLSSQTKCNRMTGFLHQNDIQSNSEIIAKDLKRKLPKIDSNKEIQIDVNPKIPKLSSVSHKIRWHK